MENKKEFYKKIYQLCKDYSPSTSSVVCFSGPVKFEGGKEDLRTFVEIASCHEKIRLFKYDNDSWEDFLFKINEIANAMDDFASYIRENFVDNKENEEVSEKPEPDVRRYVRINGVNDAVRYDEKNPVPALKFLGLTGTGDKMENHIAEYKGGEYPRLGLKNFPICDNDEDIVEVNDGDYIIKYHDGDMAIFNGDMFEEMFISADNVKYMEMPKPKSSIYNN